MTWMLRQAGAGALRIPLDWPSRRLEHWGEKLNLYSYRTMTFEEDAIRAFKGVLQRLEEIYPKGFWWGLPVEDFDWGLTWASQVPPTRRRLGFPSWSWAGWQGPLFFGQPIDVKKTRRIGTKLLAWGSKSGKLFKIFDGEPTGVENRSGIGITILNDPVALVAAQALEGDFVVESHPAAEKDGFLFLEATCFHFTPDFSQPHSKLMHLAKTRLSPSRSMTLVAL